MTNQDLIKQYVDTGLGIPEYQYNKLSSNFKKTYERKRLIVFENEQDSFHAYEIKFIPKDKIEKKRIKANEMFWKGENIDPFFFHFLDDEQQREIFRNKFRDYGHKLDNKNFEMMSDNNKSDYAKMLFSSNADLSDFEFDWLDDKYKIKYTLRWLTPDKHYTALTDHQFLYLPEEERKLYFNYEIKNPFYRPTKMQWEMMTQEQKRVLAMTKVKSEISLNDEEFKLLPEESKQKAVQKFSDIRRELTPLQFGYLDDFRKRTYVMSKAILGINLPGKEYIDQLNPETKAEYEKELKK